METEAARKLRERRARQTRRRILALIERGYLTEVELIVRLVQSLSDRKR